MLCALAHRSTGRRCTRNLIHAIKPCKATSQTPVQLARLHQELRSHLLRRFISKSLPLIYPKPCTLSFLQVVRLHLDLRLARVNNIDFHIP